MFPLCFRDFLLIYYADFYKDLSTFFLCKLYFIYNILNSSLFWDTRKERMNFNHHGWMFGIPWLEVIYVMYSFLVTFQVKDSGCFRSASYQTATMALFIIDVVIKIPIVESTLTPRVHFMKADCVKLGNNASTLKWLQATTSFLLAWQRQIIRRIPDKIDKFI